MKTIAIINIKGGVGKTTIATNLAIIFRYNKNKTLLIDTNNQSSTKIFRSIRIKNKNYPLFSSIQILRPTIHKDIKNLTSFDIVIIDTEGKNSKTLRSSIIASDIIIVPTSQSPYDLWSSIQTFKILREAKEIRPELKIYGLINMIKSNTKNKKESIQIINNIRKNYNIKFLNTNLRERASYKNSIFKGLSITEYKPKDRKATKEIILLYQEINSILKTLKK